MILTTRMARFTTVLFAVWLGVTLQASDAMAAVSATGGSGVWDVQSAESKRPGRLELGFSSNYQRLPFYDALDTRLNGLQGNALGAFGLPGGFELSGSLPVFGFHDSRGDASAFDSNIDPRIGDVAARLRWTGPLGMPGMRWGLEGETSLPTGSDAVVNDPVRGPLQPFTSGEESYTGRVMLTFDALRAGSDMPLRLHANAAFTQQRDETRYLSPYAPLPLDLPAPARDRDNDRLTLSAAAELDFPRVTLFGEVLTDQFVYQRDLMRGSENRLAVTPGINFWLPGGVAITGAYTLNLAKDDAATAFNPTRAFANHEWKVGVSLGTVYRGARARAEDAAQSSVAPSVAPAASASPAPSVLAAAPAAPAKAAPDSVVAAKQVEKQVVLERRPIQEEPVKAPVVKAAPVAADTTAEEAMSTPGPAAKAAPRPVAPAPDAPSAARAVPAPAAANVVDTDGDGIPDSQDLCPLVAEDWDGFQDLDGCPDLDNDRDGILDVRDECPNDPETYNGYYDFDGCPDEVPANWNPRSAQSPEPASPQEKAASMNTPAPAPVRAQAVSPAPVRPVAAAAPAPEAQAPRPVAQAPSATAVSPGPALVAPAARPAAAAVGPSGLSAARDAEWSSMLEAERRRSDMLESRLRALELRQDQSALLAARPTTVSVPSVTAPAAQAPATGISPSSAELRERVTRLEAGHDAASARRAGELAAEVTQADARSDSTSARLLRQMAEIQASLDSLRSVPAAAPAAVDSSDPGTDSAVHWLDLELPLGQTRIFPQVVFEPASARLTMPARQSLTALGGALGHVPEARVRLVGYTDDRGDAAANLSLSHARAQSVAEALIAHGAHADQLIVEGRGEISPVASNRTSRGREQNRRVEFIRTH